MANSPTPDEVELTTVGIDIGSATSHLIFSAVLMRRCGTLSSRFAVVRHTALFRSPVTLTPYTEGETIDQDRLQKFVRDQYSAAGLTADDIDTGAVVLTGTALLRSNSRVVGDVLASHSGRLVCASAGHHFESLLAAHGSGAVASSRHGHRVLNVDIGGGTTKIALSVDGEVIDTAALAIGARLGTWTPQRRVASVHPYLGVIAEGGEAPIAVGDELTPGVEQRIASRMVGLIGEFLSRDGLVDSRCVLLPGRLGNWNAETVVFSGGVAEYVYGRQQTTFGDFGAAIGHELRSQWPILSSAEVVEGQSGIRATVVGAGQHASQVSGSTIYLGPGHRLPINGLPVVRVPTAAGVESHVLAAGLRAELRRHADRGEQRLPALAVSWPYPPEHATLRRLAEGLVEAVEDLPLDEGADLVVAVAQDIAHTLGRILVDELAVRRNVICIDGVDVGELDYVDIGEPVQPVGVVPIVVRSLLFPDPVEAILDEPFVQIQEMR
jgi:ethanolamine utilization protein EutA (predicted chaperonin)